MARASGALPGTGQSREPLVSPRRPWPARRAIRAPLPRGCAWPDPRCPSWGSRGTAVLAVPRDDHGFSPLHWACREGRASVVDMLIMRGARINVMNRGDDTPLHLAASHGHRDIVQKVPASCRERPAPAQPLP